MSDHTLSRQPRLDLTEFRLGWRFLILGVFGVVTSMSAALLYGFGTMVIPLQEAFGWSRGELQASITFLFAGVAVASQLLGWLYARFGLRRVAIVSLVLQVLCYAGLTQLNGNIVWLYVAFFAMPLLCLGTIAITWTQLISLWYERNRGLALAIILSGTGVAALVVPPLLAWCMELWGWQAGFLLLAIMPLVTTLPMALLWLHIPTAEPRSVQGEVRTAPLAATGFSFAEARKSRVFWICNVSLILSVSLIVAMVTVMVPYLQDKGVPALTASQIFSAFGASIIVGRLFVGYLLDHYSPVVISAAALFTPAIGCLILLVTGPESMALLVLATVCIGLSAGAEFDIAAFLVARYFGMKDYARIFGLHLGLVTIVAGMSPAFFGYIHTQYGNYDPVIMYSLVAATVASLTLVTLRSASAFQPKPYQPEMA
ncbi:MAG: MFS transporter [Pseudomonas profundi]|uniref:MFS transporter n=1 Tax=Pseudomonas profundi TaxID=1981513 RepID=UPI0030018896